ncbi:hypothetical protein [Oleiagrimonas soli]|uniref:Uncharacterized protein n=1 Tax=Oleiagrimonas soli TaxID=1543381 RepID=A0A099CY63_9GAMM|nr:hypothetical protein [Oleiagrimonas soli]KGI78938.1 hypothetical protein LF63_0101640 [Oleiagrimonas soli]MBB6184559.1 hypothetical protein [Oleiagrimonas soli]
MSTRRALAIAMLCATPAAAWALSWPQVPLPDGTRTAYVDRHIVYNGLDMQAQVFRSSEKPDALIAFYRRRWGDKVVVNRLGAYQVVGHMQGDYFMTIQLRGLGSGSEGRIGIVDVVHVPKHPVLGKGLPIPIGSKVFNDIRYPDDPIPARTVAMRNAFSPRQNDSYFREHLEADHWKPDGRSQCDDRRCTARYARGDSRMLVVSLRGDDGYSQVVLNMQTP